MDVDHGLLLEHSKELLINSLLESSAKHPLNILDTDPHPSDLTLVLIAAAVYTEKKPRETDQAYGERLLLPEGWRLLTTASNPDLLNKYFGAAFINTGFQQVIVAHRGTIPTKVGSLYTDVKGILFNGYTSCMNSSVTFVDYINHIIQIVNTSLENFKRRYNLTITGHSLGGWLAQVSTFTVKYLKISDGALIKITSGGVHAKTVVFDSPGAKSMLHKLQDKHYTRYGADFLDRLNKLDIKVYVSAPNRINTCGAHLRTVYRILIDLSKYDGVYMETALYNEKTHAFGNFVGAFKENSPNVREVLDWAKDSDEYKALFKDRTLNQANNFHLDSEKNKINEYFEEIKKRYQVVPSEPQINFTINLNAFSEDEIKILDYLLIIQRQTDFTILNDFLLKEKLEFKNDKLFADFKINHNTGTISCKSDKLLVELKNRVKQLMRWKGLEFSKAVEEQSRTTDLIYRDEGRTYLNSIQKTSLNFTDSIGLREFLLSPTDRVLWIVTQDGTFEMTRLHNIVFNQIKTCVNISDPIHKYITEGHFTFLDWPRLQTLHNIYGSPVDQNDLLIVDDSSSPIISSDLQTFLNNYKQSSSHNLKKLVFISSHPIDKIISFENVKIFNADRKMNLIDLSVESQEIIFRRKMLSFNGNGGHSFQEFFGDSLHEFNQFISWSCLKSIMTNEEYVIILNDSRPTISDLQMPFIKTNIRTSKECVLNCVDKPNTLAVIRGLNRRDLEPGADWELLEGMDIVLIEEDAQLSFRDVCMKNHDKLIYLFDVLGKNVYCKEMFNRGFYLDRKFFHLASIDVQKFAEINLSGDLFVICSEEDKSSFLRLIDNFTRREALTENIRIAATKEVEEYIIQKYFDKSIHFMKIGKRHKSVRSCEKYDSDEGNDSDERYERDESYELKWRYSRRSVASLFPCMSRDSCEPMTETALSKSERNLVIMIDEPGMGKTTSLARLSRLVESPWVIYIELKNFQVHVEKLPEVLTVQSVASFLLSEGCTETDSSPVHGLLEYLLQSKTHSKQVVLMFDGFDELDDYVLRKESSKGKLVRLFAFLQDSPAIQTIITARNYLKESLEEQLRQTSTCFVRITEQEQLHYLLVFWRSCLSLELGDYGEEEEGRLEEYAGEVLRQAKEVLGPDMDRFMGVPLQLRMLAEVFRPQSDQLLQSPEVKIVSASNLYKKFITLKYEIYFNDKTMLGAVTDNFIKKQFVDITTAIHSKLAFRTFFPVFYDENFDPIEDEWLDNLNRIGLVQTKGNGEFQFIHRTYAEYCCAQMVINLLNQPKSFSRYHLFKKILIPQILLHPDSKIIRLFMNVQLNETAMSKNSLELNAKCICQLWLEDSALFRNQEHQTPLHIAVKEKNENIVAFLFSGLNIESTQKEFVSFITQYDHDNNTAMNLVDIPIPHDLGEDDSVLDNTMIKILQCIKTCSDDIKERVIFASLFNRHISEYDTTEEMFYCACLFNRNSYDDDESIFRESSFHQYLFSMYSLDTKKLIFINSFYRDVRKYISCISKIFDRVKEVELVVKPFAKAIENSNVELVKDILSKQLKHNVERYCLFLMKHRGGNWQTGLHIAVENGNLDMVKLLAKQTNVPFSILMEQWNGWKEIPLHTASENGQLNIVKYLLEHCADIDGCVEGGPSALIYAAIRGQLLIVKYLVESGANTNATGFSGRTALKWAAQNGHLPVVEYLLQQDVGGRKAALIRASQQKKWDVVWLLLERGVDVNADDSKTLSWAIQENEWSIVKVLVDKGASIKESQILHNSYKFKEEYPYYEFKKE